MCGRVVVMNGGPSFKPRSEDDGEAVGVQPGWLVGVKRGGVKGLSADARRRMLRLMGQWPKAIFDRCVVFSTTLTYPKVFPTAKESKRHFEAFREALRRRWPSAFAVWKLEPQRRGAPHYHLVIAIPPENVRWSIEAEIWLEDDFHGWVAGTWFRIAGNGDPLHLEFHLGSDRVVERVRSYRQFMGYLAKYVGKAFEADPSWDAPGRFWGVINRAEMERWVSGKVWRLSAPAYDRVRRVLRKRAPKGLRKRISEGWTWWTWGSETTIRRLVEWAEPGVVEVFEETYGFW